MKYSRFYSMILALAILMYAVLIKADWLEKDGDSINYRTGSAPSGSVLSPMDPNFSAEFRPKPGEPTPTLPVFNVTIRIVFEINQQPASDVRVILSRNSSSPALRDGRTDGGGNLTFSLEAGNYFIRTGKNGYEDRNFFVQIPEDIDGSGRLQPRSLVAGPATSPVYNLPPGTHPPIVPTAHKVIGRVVTSGPELGGRLYFDTIDCYNTYCDSNFLSGTRLRFVAVALPGFEFDSWTMDCHGNSPDVTFLIHSDFNCGVRFKQRRTPTTTKIVTGATLGAGFQKRQFFLADFNGDRFNDLFMIIPMNSGSGMLEVHILDGRNNFKNFLAHLRTPSEYRYENVDLSVRDTNFDGIPDLAIVIKNGPKMLELHVLDGASWYQSFSTHVATGQGPIPTNSKATLADYDGDWRPDILFSLRNNDVPYLTSPRLEIHAVNGLDYWSSLVHLETSYPPIPDNYKLGFGDFDNDGRQDLYFVTNLLTGSKWYEVHALSHSSRFQGFVAHTVLTDYYPSDEILVGDINNDGITELIRVRWAMSESGYIEIRTSGF